MGNCFGKPSSESESNNFGGTGRTVGTANATTPSTTARIPAKVKGPGRRLGDENSASTEDPKAAAARAAEERVKAAQSKGGKLSKQLNAQKSQTRSETLAQASRDTQAARDADAVNETRAYN